MLSHLIIAAVIVIVFIAIARITGSAKGKRGNSLNKFEPQRPQPSSNTFTVATFNIQGGKNLNGERDIDRSSQAIKEVDLIGVQEAYAPTHINKLKLGFSQTELLAQPGRFDWLFCATKTRWFREFRGNSILSKLDTKSWSTQMLPHKVGNNFRNMAVVEMNWQGEDFHFINTHLHTKDGKEEQFNAVMEEFNKHSRAILVGDFNSKPHEAHIINMLSNDDIVDAINVCDIDFNEENRIDWILCKGFKVHEGKMIEKGISDHPYYQVTLSII